MAIMSHLGGFSAYRKTLTEVSPMKPCLPYLGVILSDLVHVNEKPTYLGPSSSSIERLASSSVCFFFFLTFQLFSFYSDDML